MAKSRKKAAAKPSLRFADRLMLHQWMLSLLGVKSFEALAEHLKSEALEGLDENRVHRYHHALTAELFNLTQITTDRLLEYDQNIVRHTLRLNERRITRGEQPVVWKYFQYLALLFTEIYLDRYFHDPEGLLAELDAHVAAFNEGKEPGDRVERFDLDAEAWPQLNKLAFWMATGSGKTLLLHANILQYQHYLERAGRRRELNRILLLTPNEGLSRQHLEELDKAGIQAELFDKEGRRLFAGHAVEILDIHKLKDEMGAKTIAVEAFEGNNLVLVDEGHRGATGGEEGSWMRFRDALCEKGFSFEYSATFGQAVKGSQVLADRYAKGILFDYSYRWFYGDGFGKDYQILNLDEKTEASHLDLYLVAALLSFFQQQRLYREQGEAFRPFQIEKPLWIFVGGSVTATLAKRDAADVVAILKFLARYAADRTASVRAIDRVLNQGLVTADGRNLFANRFGHLNTAQLSPAQIFDETLATLFNAPAGGHLCVVNLKGVSGEIALRLGAENEPFGVINVGDDAKLVKICEENGLATDEREFAESLFQKLNQSDSTVHLLIGSRKFTEGWSSWRVSTMGLMNIGKGEGAQIIQLFGRGVRLKGYGTSLKRSGRADLPEGIERPKQIGLLETLGIFGIQADYMAQFREYLEEEGLPTNDDRIEIRLPVIKGLGTLRLKTVRLKKKIRDVETDFGAAFRQLGPVPTLAKPDPSRPNEDQYFHQHRLEVNWYPKIQAMKSKGLAGADAEATTQQGKLSHRHVALLDLDRLEFELERFKAERSWYNLNLTRLGIEELLADPSWYVLWIPKEELAFDTMSRVRAWEEIALALLQKYTERYYTYRKREWELPHLEYRDLESDDPNFLCVREAPDESYYTLLIDRSQEEIVAKIQELKAAIERGDFRDWSFQGLRTIWFENHLYKPLLYADRNLMEIRPVALNKGECLFVEDLKAYCDAHPSFFADKQLYLLRNLSKGRGVGFFEAGNFHPDFILWLLSGDRQNVVFVDPKGVLHLPLTDPKIRFHEAIHDIESRLGDPRIFLDSFIVSNTPSATMRLHWNLEKHEMEARHVLFQEDQGGYVKQMLSVVEKR